MANKDKHDYLHAATVHILDKSEATVGTGCYVGKYLIATCAHVIRSAVLGVDENIKFKFHHETDIFEGKLVSEFWRDPNKEDIAFIKVTSEHLKEVTPLKIGDGSYSSGHKIITVGYPFISDEYDVLWSEGYITGTLLHPQKGLMLQAKIPTIMRGMSGAPIYDVDSDFVIGFISEYLSNSDVVWITPSETLKEVNPAIVFKLPSDVSNYLDAFTKFAQNLPYVSIKSEKVIDQIYVRQIAKEANIVTKQLNKKNSNEAQPITDLFLNSKMVALIGIPGMGKSSLLRYILLHQSVFLTGNYLPLLASISGLVEKKGTLQYMLKAQLMDELGARLLLPIPDNFLGEWHDRTGMNWLIALDGLDEITNNTNRKLFIRELMRAPWPEGTVIVITSRPNEEIYLLDDFIHYELLPFSEEQIQAFASKWFSSKKRAKAFLSTIENQKLIETNSTPLMLTIAATIFENQQISQFNRSALYDSYIKQILEEDLNPHRQIYQQLINSVGITLGEKIFRHRRLLIEKIAYSAQSKKPNDKGLADQLNTNPFNIGNLDIQEILELVLEFGFRISLMVKRGNRIEFIHPTFREFLAASYIIRTSENNPDQIWKRLFSKWQNKYWTQTVIFGFLLLYHQGFDIETFISKIYDSSDEDFPNTSDVTKSNLFLGLLLSENIKIEYSTTSKVITALVNILIDGKNNLDIGQALRILSQLNGEYPTIYLQLFELFKNRDFFSIEYNFTILDIMISYQWDSTYIKNIAIELEKGKLSKTHQAELIVRMIRIGFYDEAKDLLYILVQQFIRNQYSENHD